MRKVMMAAGLTAGIVFAATAGEAGAAARKPAIGKASWYKMGKRTANGERFNPNGLTAAHRSLRFGTRVRVTNLRNGRRVVVRINDRGPFAGNRIIDLSMGAARAIGMIRAGITRVKVEILR